MRWTALSKISSRPRCLVVNRSLRDTVRLRDSEVRFMTIWDLLFGELDTEWKTP